MKNLLVLFMSLLPVAVVIQAAETSPAAVKINNENWCGSGNICGYDTVDNKVGAWVSTNAHVATTRIGDRMLVTVELPNQDDMQYEAVNKIAAYSNKYQTDWAFIFVPGLTAESGITPVKLSKNPPEGRNFETTGSPRCVWPLRSYDLVLQDMVQGDRVYRWLPISVGGQSGSAVRNASTGIMELLLTWSWGRYGAGQPTNLIYQQKQKKTVKGPLRVEGLIELGSPGMNRCEEGFFEDEETAAALKVQDLPVWADDSGDPPPAEGGLTDDELAAALIMKQLGLELPALAEFYGAILKPVAPTTDIELSGPETPWTPPPTPEGGLVLGTVHDGMKLTKRCVFDWVALNLYEDYSAWTPPSGTPKPEQIHNGKKWTQVKCVFEWVPVK